MIFSKITWYETKMLVGLRFEVFLPVNRHVILCMVSNVDKKSIPFPNVNCWPWKHSIYCDYWLRMTQSAYILYLNLEMQVKGKRNLSVKKCMHMHMKSTILKSLLLTSNWYVFTSASTYPRRHTKRKWKKMSRLPIFLS